MLTIRLSRIGKKNSAFFRVVVMDKRKSSFSGRFLEILGHIHPHTKERSFKKDRILYWIGVGAQPSDSVFNLLVKANILKGPKKVKKVRIKAKNQEGEAENASAPKEAEPVKEEKTTSEVKEEVAEIQEEAKEEVKEEVKEEIKEEEPKEEAQADKKEETASEEKVEVPAEEKPQQTKETK